MFFSDRKAVGGASLLLLLVAATPLQALKHTNWVETLEKRHGHDHMRLHASPRAENLEEVAHEDFEKRQVTCPLPAGAGLVPVAPGAQNAGWAMSPDQPCTPGNWCPYACPPGMLSYQWDPAATTYSYPLSMNGGLFCHPDGSVSKGYPERPYCKPGVHTVDAKNDCSLGVSYCQTVLPGNEAMLIPTWVPAGAIVTLAIPDTTYWAGTAAHYYINTPGISTADACIWSDGSKPLGNWSPYVAGGNMDANGNTFVKIGYNPIYAVESQTFNKVKPSFGVEIVCPRGGCNGLPCRIDPSTSDMGVVISPNAATGAGGAEFCVVTVPPNGLAYIRTFDLAGTGSIPDVKIVVPDTTSSSTSSSTSSTTSTSTSALPTTSSSSSSSSSFTTTSSSSSSSSSSAVATTSSIHTSNAPHIFFENVTAISTTASSSIKSLTPTLSSAPAATTSKVSSAEKAAVQRCAIWLIGLAVGIAWWL